MCLGASSISFDCQYNWDWFCKFVWCFYLKAGRLSASLIIVPWSPTKRNVALSYRLCSKLDTRRIPTSVHVISWGKTRSIRFMETAAFLFQIDTEKYESTSSTKWTGERSSGFSQLLMYLWGLMAGAMVTLRCASFWCELAGHEGHTNIGWSGLRTLWGSPEWPGSLVVRVMEVLRIDGGKGR